MQMIQNTADKPQCVLDNSKTARTEILVFSSLFLHSNGKNRKTFHLIPLDIASVQGIVLGEAIFGIELTFMHV